MLDNAGLASLGLFTFAYMVISIGELFLSPIGLSLMTKLSPKHLWGVMMGMWFLASAYGQYAAGILGAGMASEKKCESNGAHDCLYGWIPTIGALCFDYRSSCHHWFILLKQIDC